jgi:hypothetical protein
MDRDVEKISTDEGTLGQESNRPTFSPIRLETPQVTRTRSRASGNLSRCQSQNGYSCNPHQESEDDNQLDKDPFEVGWENGDSDPWCPRKFVQVKKWMIVFIVSSASLCV